MGEIVVGVRERSNSETALNIRGLTRLYATMPGHKFLTENHQRKEENLEKADASLYMVSNSHRSNPGHRLGIPALQPRLEETKED